MQQSGHHFQPHHQKAQETNFHLNLSECQFKSVSSHKCLTNSKLNLSAHTNVSLSSKGRESHPHVVSQKCLTKLHATKWQSLSTSRSKGARNKFPSKYFRMLFQKRQLTHMSHYFQIKLVSSHKCLTKLQRKGKPSPPRFTQMSHYAPCSKTATAFKLIR